MSKRIAVALMSAWLGSARAEPAAPSWTAADLEQAVLVELQRENIDLSERHRALTLAVDPEGRWTLSLADPEGMAPPLVRVAERLSPALDAAAGEVTTMVALLLQAAPIPAPMPPTPVELRVNRKLAILESTGAPHPKGPIPWWLENAPGFLGIAMAANPILIGQVWGTGSSFTWGGAAIMVAGGALSLALDAEQQPYKYKLISASLLLGWGFSQLAALRTQEIRSSETNEILLTAGFHRGIAIAAGATLASGGLTLLSAALRPGCNGVVQGKRLDALLAAPTGTREAALASVEGCYLEERDSHGMDWIIAAPVTGALLAIFTFSVIEERDASARHGYIPALLDLAWSYMAVMPLLFSRGHSETYLDRLEDEGLPLEIGAAAAPGAVGVNVSARF